MKSILYARISDNVLDVEDWPVRRLVIMDGRIVAHEDMPMTGSPVCGFDDGPQTGWTLDQLLDWASRDFTGQHPEMFYDLKAEGDDRYLYTNRRNELNALLRRGEVKTDG